MEEEILRAFMQEGSAFAIESCLIDHSELDRYDRRLLPVSLGIYFVIFCMLFLGALHGSSLPFAVGIAEWNAHPHVSPHSPRQC